MKALLVEPHAGTATTVKRVLESFGMEIRHCEDAESARILIAEECPSLIVLDQVLPGDDGFEFCREIRDRGIPAAIVILASCSPADCGDAMLVDPDDIVFRPLEAPYLRVRLALAMERANQRSREIQITRTTSALVKALETMHLGVTITDLEGRILFINHADASMHGYEVDELIGRDVRIFSHSASRNWMTVDEMKDIRSWKRESINVRKDGSIFPVMLLSDVVKDGTGEIIGIVTTCEDLSEQSAQGAVTLADEVADPV